MNRNYKNYSQFCIGFSADGISVFFLTKKKKNKNYGAHKRRFVSKTETISFLCPHQMAGIGKYEENSIKNHFRWGINVQ